MKIVALLNRVRNSLSTKFLLLYIFLSFLLLCVVVGSIAHNLKNNFKDNIRPHLLQYLEYVQDDIGNPPDKQKLVEISNKLSIDISLISKSEKWSSDGENIDLSKISHHKHFFANGVQYCAGGFNGKEILVADHGDYQLAFSIPHPRNQIHKRHTTPVLLTIILLVLFYFISRKLFLPIKTLESGVKRIGRGELSHKITINRKDELGSLANSINQMSDDIQQMLEAKRQLLLAISHELRSPVTRAKVAVALLAENEYSKSIEDELNEIDLLIEEILETERLSSQHQKLNLTDANISEVVKSELDNHFQNNKLLVNIQRIEQKINIDVPRIKLLVKNLVDNAIKNTPRENSAPVVSLSSDDINITFTVKDFGSGVEEKHIASLTEPFYRVDPSRQRKTGGYGLGLYLCKVIVEAHSGQLKIESKMGKGTIVSFSIPVETRENIS